MSAPDAALAVRRAALFMAGHASFGDVVDFCYEAGRIGDPLAAIGFLEECGRIGKPGKSAALMGELTEELKKLPSYGLHEGPRSLFFQACMRVRERQRQR